MERKTKKVKMSEEKIYCEMALNNNKFSKCSQKRPTNLMSQKREGGGVFLQLGETEIIAAFNAFIYTI